MTGVNQAPATGTEQLKRALEAGHIDQDTYEAAIAGLKARLNGSGAIAQGPDSTAVGDQGVAIGGESHGDVNTGHQISAEQGAQIIYAESGATIVIGEVQVPMTAVNRHSTLGHYLQHLISQNRYLQLQGIRSGGKLVNIELDRIYVTLRTSRQRAQRAEVGWLANETALAPGERQRGNKVVSASDTTQVSVNEALFDHKRLVVLGDPGSGKTTLLRYLALLYGRDYAEGQHQVPEKLGLADNGVLPVFLALRQIGRYLAEHHAKDDGTEGHAILLQFLVRTLKQERIEVPADFFDEWLKSGRAVVLLDGLDEVADPALRRRVSRLVDAFTRAYPDCRYVITSRIVGYTEASSLAEGYATTIVRDFTIDDVGDFLSQWHRLVAIGQMGAGDTAEASAANQTRQLLASIEQNERVRDLAINPLMLTVIALIHRDRVKLPDRRAELYQEAVDVLLGKWDEARGVQDSVIIHDRPFDISDRRLLLQHVALEMHQREIKEIDAEPLRILLAGQLGDAVTDPRDLDASVERFLGVIRERSGLLIARAEGTYAFSHLTFQEYLAALAIAGRDDYVDFSLRHTADEWWREVILLEAGYLSTQSKEKATRLIGAIAAAKTEPQPYHNLVLASECLSDAGANRVVGNLEAMLRGRLQHELESPSSRGLLGAVQKLVTRGITPTTAIARRIAAAEALGKIGGSRFWALPHGEPDWVAIPQGEFVMGDAIEAHRVLLPHYEISRIPITNAQYQIFVQAIEHDPPDDWNGRSAPRGKEIHPVVNVSWHDALAYCRWLSEVTGKPITLPSEAEWEKAARGANDARNYPWGETVDPARCNVYKSEWSTIPVGIFLNGASPYGCLDMVGNVCEWTRSRNAEYPYDARNDVQKDLISEHQVLIKRGGSWSGDVRRCTFRGWGHPGGRNGVLGFRVVLRSAPEL